MASPESSYTPANDSDENHRGRSAEPTSPISREGSRPPKKKHNVRFTPGGESLDTTNQRATFDLRDDTNAPPKPKPLSKAKSKPKLDSGIWNRSNASPSIRRSRDEKSEDIADETVRAPVPKLRPSIMRLPSSDSEVGEEPGQFDDKENQKKVEMTKNEDDEEEEEDEDEDAPAKVFSQKSAQDRAEHLSRMIGSQSAPGSRYTSPHRPQRIVVRSPPPSPPLNGQGETPIDLNDLPLEKLETRRTKYGLEDDTDQEEDIDLEKKKPRKKKATNRFVSAATRFVRHHKKSERSKQSSPRSESPEPRSGAQTPVYERDPDNYVPRPTEYREGYLSSLLKLYNQEGLGSAISHIPAGPGGAAYAARQSSSGLPLLRSSQDGAADSPDQTPLTTPGGSPLSSGTSTPKQKHQKWYYKTPANQSSGALSDLVSSSTVFAQPGGAKQSSVVRPKLKHRPLLDAVRGKKSKAKTDEAMYIRIHQDETMQRHAFLLKMCRALMSYGAPTHRLEGMKPHFPLHVIADKPQNT